jgi:hypothetical protein
MRTNDVFSLHFPYKLFASCGLPPWHSQAASQSTRLQLTRTQLTCTVLIYFFHAQNMDQWCSNDIYSCYLFQNPLHIVSSILKYPEDACELTHGI